MRFGESSILDQRVIERTLLSDEYPKELGFKTCRR